MKEYQIEVTYKSGRKRTFYINATDCADMMCKFYQHHDKSRIESVVNIENEHNFIEYEKLDEVIKKDIAIIQTNQIGTPIQEVINQGKSYGEKHGYAVKTVHKREHPSVTKSFRIRVFQLDAEHDYLIDCYDSFYSEVYDALVENTNSIVYQEFVSETNLLNSWKKLFEKYEGLCYQLTYFNRYGEYFHVIGGTLDVDDIDYIKDFCKEYSILHTYIDIISPTSA